MLTRTVLSTISKGHIGIVSSGSARRHMTGMPQPKGEEPLWADKMNRFVDMVGKPFPRNWSGVAGIFTGFGMGTYLFYKEQDWD